MTASPSSILTLKKLSRQFPATQEMFDMLLEITRQNSDRSTAITYSALLERGLEELVASKMAWPTEESNAAVERKALFEGDAPLSTFSAKTRLGYALGLYNKLVRDDLDTIREIRNAFAHATTNITFATDEVSVVVSRLKLHHAFKVPSLGFPERINTPVLKFGLIATVLTGLFLQVASDNGDPEWLRELGVSFFLQEPDDFLGASP